MRPLVTFLSLTVLFLTGCQTSNYNNTDGVKYFGQAKYDQAIRSFQTARSVDPEDADAWYNLGATYHKLGSLARQSGQQEAMVQQFTLAEENYRTALQKNPEHTAAYRGLAVMWCELGHQKEAFELLGQWVNRNQASADAKVELARLYQEHQRVDDAAALLQSALAVNPNDSRALRASGFLNEAAGRNDLAVDQYQRSLAANPDQQDLSNHLAAVRSRVQTSVGAPIIAPYQTTGETQIASPVIAPYQR